MMFDPDPETLCRCGDELRDHKEDDEGVVRCVCPGCHCDGFEPEDD